MYKLLLDSDALIKLTHSEMLYKLCKIFNCLITNEVREETVQEGKKRFYPDALAIEKLIENNFVKIKCPKRKLRIKEDFGKGEKSVLELYRSTRNSIIITDDSKFISYLEKENIPFFIPSDLIVLLKGLNEINLKESLYFLGKMRVFIKEDVYNETKKELGG